MSNLVFLFLLLLPLASGRAVAGVDDSDSDPFRGFDEYVKTAMATWDIAGMAIGVVHHDKIILSKGYGVREQGKNEPVDPQTMFAIGSCTKAFTTTALGMLVDEGKLTWDDKVEDLLPEFRLFDPYVSRELTVRDLLTHRVGLERADLLVYGTPYERDEVLRRLRFIKPSWSFRSRFGYQNSMYLAAGQIAGKIAGKSWDTLIRERIFIPLGMKSSHTSLLGFALAEDKNLAQPHIHTTRGPAPVPWRNIDNSGPAGAINSNIIDMMQWIRFHLNDGVVDGKSLVTTTSLREMQMPQMTLRLDEKSAPGFPEAHFLAYGLGWFLHDFRGRKIVEHGGNIDGMSALAAYVPEEKLGLVILCNADSSRLPAALMYRIFDAFMPGMARDWSSEFMKNLQAYARPLREAEKKYADARQPNTMPSLALEKYAGEYLNEIFPNLKITHAAGKLHAEFGTTFVGDLEHWHYDTFVAHWKDPFVQTAPNIYVTFRLNALGIVEEVKMMSASSAMVPELTFKSEAAAAKERKVDLPKTDETRIQQKK